MLGWFAAFWGIYVAIFLGNQLRVSLTKQAGERVSRTDRTWLAGFLLQALAVVAVFYFPRTRITELELVLSCVGAVASIVFAVWTLQTLGRHWRLPAAVLQGDRLVKHGPYSLVRHPVYLTLIAMTFATGLGMSRWWALLAGVVLSIVGTEVRVRAEDRVLQRHFGSEFDAYERQVKAYLPFIR